LAPPFDPPSDFADQLNDRNSPIFIDSSVPNTLFTLPQNATSGLSSFAYTVGLRPQDLFPVCLIVFLSIIAATILLSLLIWAFDSMAPLIVNTLFSGHRKNQYGGTRSPRYSAASKDILDGLPGAQSTIDEDRSHSSHFLFKASKCSQGSRKKWFRFRPNFTSFHFSVLHGNLVRILMLFHLPVTIFSSYALTLGHGQASTLCRALAALSLVLFSIAIPIWLNFRLFVTSTGKLYDETWTLLALGPLYNHYRHGSQLYACMFFATSLILGITIGFGQKSGIAQAIIILLVEVISALVTSIWLPWGHGASMGLISFLFCVARIVVAVLLVILTPTVSILWLLLVSMPNRVYS
jgi:Transient receptor potential (TRP) ion channel